MLRSQTARMSAWKSFIADSTEMAGVWKRAMQTLFRMQREEVLTNLVDAVSEKSSSASQTDIGMSAWSVKANTDDILFDYDEEVQDFREVMDDLMKETIKKSGKDASERFGLGIDFDLQNPRVRDYVDRYALDKAKAINQTTRDALRKTLKEGLDAGENVRDLSERIAKVYGQAVDFRSERIARTETIAASNFGALESYQQAGLEKKEWMTEPGANNPRHELIDGLNGQVVAVNEPFDVDGEDLMYPGDPRGSPENVIN